AAPGRLADETPGDRIGGAEGDGGAPITAAGGAFARDEKVGGGGIATGNGETEEAPTGFGGRPTVGPIGRPMIGAGATGAAAPTTCTGAIPPIVAPPALVGAVICGRGMTSVWLADRVAEAAAMMGAACVT